MRRVTAGAMVVGIGVLHNVVGLLVGWPHLEAILGDGYVAAVPDDAPWRMAIFWFLWFGWMLMILGASWHWAERRGLVLPRWLGALFVGMGVAGGVAMPASGFWLVLPVGWLVWHRAGGGAEWSAVPAAPRN